MLTASWASLLRETANLYLSHDHQLTDWLAVYGSSGGKVFCGKGCNGCCSLAVNCTFPEAALIAAQISAEQAKLMQIRTEKLKNLLPTITDLKSFLRLHRSELGGCPFLSGERGCSIYPYRPLSCRSLLSTQDSYWCGVDFSTLSSEVKHEFMNSLDRGAVAFPMHYAAIPQELGAGAEQRLLSAMREQFGFQIYGNLPLLIHLEREFTISSIFVHGVQAVSAVIASTNLLHPYLITIEQ